MPLQLSIELISFFFFTVLLERLNIVRSTRKDAFIELNGQLLRVAKPPNFQFAGPLPPLRRAPNKNAQKVIIKKNRRRARTGQHRRATRTRTIDLLEEPIVMPIAVMKPKEEMGKI